MKKKWIIIIFSILLILIVSLGIVLSLKSNKYSYQWIDEPESIIGQSRLYINNQLGKHIDGKVTITYLNGNSEEINISKNGVLYVKSIIKEVKNPRR